MKDSLWVAKAPQVPQWWPWMILFTLACSRGIDHELGSAILMHDG